MREIIFRGKNFCGEWEYGVPVFSGLNNELAFMKQMHSYDHQVIPETVGQYTGLTDKNSTKIFEGDIVKWGINYTIAFMRAGYVLKKDMNPKMYDYSLMAFDGTELEVIGNIHDNPELLKGE